MRTRHIVLGVLAAFFATGCGACTEKVAEMALEKATGVSVDEESGKVTFKGKDGEVLEINSEGEDGAITFKGKEGEVRLGEKKLPDNFPIGVFSDSVVQASASMGNDKERSWMASLENKGDMDAIVSFYEGELKKQGFEIERNEYQFDETKMVNLGGRQEGREANISVASGPNGLLTQISYKQSK